MSHGPPPVEIGGATRIFAVLGDPVSHSLSPRLQNAAFQATGVDAVYVALRTGAADLVGLMRGLAAAGGGGNVTLPHKTGALEAAERVLPAARRSGAANTFWMEEGALVVDNTDVEGFRRALEGFRPGAVAGRRVLLLGAGGAARAVAVALLEGGVEAVTVLNRTPRRARELVALLDDPRMGMAADATSVEVKVDLVVNATRLGLHPGDPLPLEPAALRATQAEAVFDLVYGSSPHGTPFVAEARRQGMAATGGREMLLHQGARAFEHWWGRPAPLEAMRAALEGPGVG